MAQRRQHYRRDVFPLCEDEGGGFLCVAKDAHADEWMMCHLPKEKEGWMPIFTEWDAPKPSFTEYLDRLGTAIHQGHVVASQYGSMVRPGSEPVVHYPFFRDAESEG